jgi:hypothetical protein
MESQDTKPTFALTTEQEARFKTMVEGAELLKGKKLTADEKTAMHEQLIDVLIAEKKAEEVRLEMARIANEKMHAKRMAMMMPHDRINKA